MPVGKCAMRIAESVLLMCWPPAQSTKWGAGWRLTESAMRAPLSLSHSRYLPDHGVKQFLRQNYSFMQVAGSGFGKRIRATVQRGVRRQDDRGLLPLGRIRIASCSKLDERRQVVCLREWHFGRSESVLMAFSADYWPW